MSLFRIGRIVICTSALVLVGYVIGGAEDAAPPSDAASYAWILDEQSHTLTTIGSQEGPDNAFFGDISDVVVEDTIIHVLGSNRMQLSATSFSGHRLAETGAEGQAPGEFLGPNVAWTTDAGQVVVHDRQGVLKYFSFDPEPAELRYMLDSTQTFFRAVSDMCRAGDRLVLYPNNQPGTPAAEGEGAEHLLLHLPFPFTSASSEARHFGARPSFLEDIEERFLGSVSRGRVHCTAQNRVLVSHLLDTRVDIYDEAAQAEGHFPFADLHAPTFEVIQYDGADWAHIQLRDSYLMSNMVSLDATRVLVQFAHYPDDWSGRNFDRSLIQHTYVLNVSDQEATFLGTTDKVFHYVTDSQYVASKRRPQPIVYVASKK